MGAGNSGLEAAELLLPKAERTKGGRSLPLRRETLWKRLSPEGQWPLVVGPSHPEVTLQGGSWRNGDPASLSSLPLICGQGSIG